jgi:rfaE bifunctional protein nucleotidyltransferase chain/domain/rfaE bifunctional protein kinase chain/domain
VVVGDAVLDRDVTGTVARVCPDAPVPVVDVGEESARCGGAGLAAALLARDGCEVVLVTALARDAGGDELRRLLAASGVEVVDMGFAGGGSTAEKIRVRATGQSLVRVDRGSRPSPPRPLPDRGRRVVAGAGALLVADYGRGIAGAADVRAAVTATRSPVVWDPHPRGPSPVSGVRLATPNAGEAAALVPSVPADGLAGDAARAVALAERWQTGGVAVTLGRRGALLAGHGGPPLVVPPAAEVPPHVDTCGAGDRFAGAAARALGGGAVVSEAVEAAVAAATAFVAAGGAAGVGFGSEVRGPAVRPGTVVATGGCFDLLHAGHVATLRAARQLGDRLVVLLNSDDSVRRLKGPDRPLQPEADRAAVLAALDCVDEVVIFDEDTPAEALGRLRPDVFVKGGDYAVADLPEAAVLARWGGQAVVVPYLAGRSSTRLIEEARRARA